MVSAVFDVLENSEKLMDFRILIVINKLKVNKLLPVCHLKTVRLKKERKKNGREPNSKFWAVQNVHKKVCDFENDSWALKN